MRAKLIVILFVILSLLVVSPVSAQEDGASLDKDVLYAIVTFGVIIGGGVYLAFKERQVGRLLDAQRQLLERKDILDQAERAYIRSSLPVRSFVDMFESITTHLGSLNLPYLDPYLDNTAEFLETITDGEENVVGEDELDE